MRLAAYRPNLLDCAVAAVMRCFRNCTSFNFAPAPTAWEICPLTEAMECAFFRRTCTGAYEIRAVAVGAETNQVTGVAFGTFHAMANTERHLYLICIRAANDDGAVCEF